MCSNTYWVVPHLGEIKLANRVATEGYIVLKWGDSDGTNGSDIVSVDLKTNTVVLWDNKYRSDDKKKLELSRTFDKDALTKKGNPSGACDGAKDEAIKAIRASTDPKIQAISNKLIADLLQGNVETHTVGSGALEGQEIIQKYRDNQKVNDGNTTTTNTDTNTKEISKCDPLKTKLCSK